MHSARAPFALFSLQIANFIIGPRESPVRPSCAAEKDRGYGDIASEISSRDRAQRFKIRRASRENEDNYTRLIDSITVEY